MASKLETMPEIQPLDIYVESHHDLEELHEKMNYICNQTAHEFYKLTCQSLKVSDILEKNFTPFNISNA